MIKINQTGKYLYHSYNVELSKVFGGIERAVYFEIVYSFWLEVIKKSADKNGFIKQQQYNEELSSVLSLAQRLDCWDYFVDKGIVKTRIETINKKEQYLYKVNEEVVQKMIDKYEKTNIGGTR